MGSWVTYGLGSETSELPSFVVMSTGGGISGGAACWSSGFLPGVYSGTRFRSTGDPILNVSTPSGIAPGTQGDTIELINAMNQRRLKLDGGGARQPDRELRNGLPPANLRRRNVMDLRQETRPPWRCMVAIQRCHPSPAPASWLAAWSNAASASSISTTKDGTRTAMSRAT